MGLKPRSASPRAARMVAFLRGMNLGRRRITNVDLCAAFEGMGFANVSAFLASGNVIFETDTAADALEDVIATGLESALDYPVPTFVRSMEEVRAIAGRTPFSPAALAQSSGKVQVILLATPPSPAGRKAALALSCTDDRLALHGRELYWLPKGGLSDSDLSIKAIEAAAGPTTIRTGRTLERIAAKYS